MTGTKIQSCLNLEKKFLLVILTIQRSLSLDAIIFSMILKAELIKMMMLDRSIISRNSQEGNSIKEDQAHQSLGELPLQE